MLLDLAHSLLIESPLADISRLAQQKSLDANDNQLVGEFPANMIELAAVITLVLRSNRFHRIIPSEIGNLKAMETPDLPHMRLDGGLPSGLGGRTSLQKLDLSSNKLYGSVPADLGELSGLKELDLDGNRSTGAVPAAMGNLTSLTIFNVSYNHLLGKMPSENSLVQFAFVSFVGNPDRCGAPWTILCQDVVQSQVSPPTKTPATAPIQANNVKDKQRSPSLTDTGIIGMAITAADAVTVLVVSLLSVLNWWKTKRTEQWIHEETYIDGLRSLETPVGKLVLLNSVDSSTYDERIKKGIGILLDKDRIVGRGSIGTVYKATIKDHITIIEKTFITLIQMRDAEEFEADMCNLDILRHRNLVMLQGYYLSTTLKLILSVLVPNGTLSDHLHQSPLPMSLRWLQRYKIGFGIE